MSPIIYAMHNFIQSFDPMKISDAIASLQRQLEEKNTLLQQTSEELQEMLEEMEIIREERVVQNEELLTTREVVELERQRYQDLFEFAPDGYLLTDAKGMIQEANCAAASLLCIHAENLVGKPLLVFFAELDRKTFHQRLMKLRQVQNWQVYLKPRGCPSFPASITVAAAYDLQGKPVRLRWLIRDISDRKQAENSIKFQANILSQVNDAVIVIDSEQRITYWNQGAERLYNLKLSQVLGQRLEQAYQPRWTQPEEEQAVCDSLAQTGAWRGEIIHWKKSGEEIYVETSLSVLKDDSSTVAGFLAVNRDITERKQGEQKIREQAALLDITTDAILVHDLQYQILFWNNSALKSLSLPRF